MQSSNARSLDNVKLENLNINGPHTPQNEEDYDMTYEIVKSIDKDG